MAVARHAARPCAELHDLLARGSSGNMCSQFDGRPAQECLSARVGHTPCVLKAATNTNGSDARVCRRDTSVTSRCFIELRNCVLVPDAASVEAAKAQNLYGPKRVAILPESLRAALDAAGVTLRTSLVARHVRLYSRFLSMLHRLLCTAGSSRSCMRPTACEPPLPHAVTMLSTHGGSGTTRTQELFELFTGRSTQAVNAEAGRFQRSWGPTGDGSYYVTLWRSHPLTGGRVRRPGPNDTALIKSHEIDWGCRLNGAPSACYVWRVVHIVRNPLDNVVGALRVQLQAHFSRRWARSQPWAGALNSHNGTSLTAEQLASWHAKAVTGVHEYVDFHVRTLTAYRRRTVLLVHYEELSRWPAREIERILRFIGVASEAGDALARAREAARSTARLGPYPGDEIPRLLPWYFAKLPQLFDEGTVEMLVDAFEATLNKQTESGLSERVQGGVAEM